MQFAIEQARFYDKCNLASGADRTSCQVRGQVQAQVGCVCNSYMQRQMGRWLQNAGAT